MTQKLAKPLAPGAYKAFLRTVGPRHPDGESAIVVAIGDTAITFKWKAGGKQFGWQPGLEFKIANAASTISFTASKFGGYGHGVIYEPLRRSIWVDTLYITSDLKEQKPPGVSEERAIRYGIAPGFISPRPSYRLDNQKTPGPVGAPKLQPILLKAFGGRQNIWPNSSFELGMNDGWAFGGYNQPYVFTDSDLDPEKPFHGKYSLRVPAQKNPFSRPYYLEASTEVTLSVRIRGKGAKVIARLLKVHEGLEPLRARPFKGKPALTATGTGGDEWSSITAGGQLTPGWYYLQLESQQNFWADAIQLVKGKTAPDYSPRAELEGALRTGRLGNIVYPSQKSLTAWFHNSGKQTKSARLRYRIVNVRDVVVSEGVTPYARVKADATVSKAMDILPQEHGIFSVVFSIDGRSMPEGEVVYVKMPRPAEKRTRHQLGANISFNAQELALQARLGLKWTLTCKTRIVGAASEYVHQKQDVWRWADEAAALPAKFGMDAITCFWPHRIPDFMVDKQAPKFRVTRGGHSFSPDIPQWKDYVSKVTSHYKSAITNWCVDDEAELSWSPEQFARVVNATIQAVNENGSGVKIGLSGTPEFTEELLKHVDVNSIAFFGGSTFDIHHWESKRVKRICDRYGKRWICYGVGQRPPTSSMYHTLYTYVSPRHKAAWMARQMVYLYLVQDVQVAGHYAGVLRNDGVHTGLNKPLCDYDGTPIPWGATFGIMGTRLADAVPEGEVDLGETGLIAYLFRIGDTWGAATWSTSLPEYDHHWKPARRVFNEFTIPGKSSDVEILDMYWNRLEGVEARTVSDTNGNVLVFDLDEEPVFILDRNLGKQKLIESLKRARARKPKINIKISVTNDKTAGLVLEAQVHNLSGKKLSKGTIDMRQPLNKPVCLGAEAVFPNPVAPVEEMEPNEISQVTVPISMPHEAALEDGLIRVTYRSDDGSEAAADDWLWILPCHKSKAPKIDGKPNEWTTQPVGTLIYDWAWARFGRNTGQIHRGGQFFSYPSYSLDGRASFKTSYDDTNLYLLIEIEDDQPLLYQTWGERIRLVFGTGDPIAKVDILPRMKGNDKAVLTNSTTKEKLEIKAVSTDTGHQIILEVVIPWKSLPNVSPVSGAVIGFDLFWIDVDREDNEVVSGTLRWAGSSKKWGYLYLR